MSSTGADSAATIVSRNPATLEIVGTVPVTSESDLEHICHRARTVFPSWRDMGYKRRNQLLGTAADYLLEEQTAFSQLITEEMGRPLTESLLLEVHGSLDLFAFNRRCANRLLKERRLRLRHPFLLNALSRVAREPLGVLGIIAPWNWPLMIPLGCILPALLVGNCVIFKHSDVTPVMGEKLAALFSEAGIPDGVFQTVSGYAGVGRALVESPVDKIFFTGSTEVGGKIMRQVTAELKPVVLELGGNDAALVCADADPDLSASGITWGAFTNCGQNCNAIERVFAHRTIYAVLLEKLIERVDRLRPGNGSDPGTNMGPLASEAQLAKMIHMVDFLKDRGARVVTGGRRVSREGYFFAPTIMEWCGPLDEIPDEEIFGPIVVVAPVGDEEEAVRCANRSSFGLAASIWTRDLKKAKKIGRRIQAGSVVINDAVIQFGISEASWTGVKKSGMGWVHGEKGFLEMVNEKYIYGARQFRGQRVWWFPYGRDLVRHIQAALNFLYNSNPILRLKALPKVVYRFWSYLLLNRRRKNKW